MRDVSFAVDTGEVFGLLGPNRAGHRERLLDFGFFVLMVALAPRAIRVAIL